LLSPLTGRLIPLLQATSVHELSIALELVDLASSEAQRLGAARVVAVHVRAGPASGIVAEALHFSFEVAAAGTMIEGALLQIEAGDLAAWCPACSEARVLATPHHRRCSVCDYPTPELVCGDGLELTALEIMDAPADR
jgi:hydrogenase nickel incorporation protein HypA/HybF